MDEDFMTNELKYLEARLDRANKALAAIYKEAALGTSHDRRARQKIIKLAWEGLGSEVP